jgi:hypothetical protein
MSSEQPHRQSYHSYCHPNQVDTLVDRVVIPPAVFLGLRQYLKTTTISCPSDFIVLMVFFFSVIGCVPQAAGCSTACPRYERYEKKKGDQPSVPSNYESLF